MRRIRQGADPFSAWDYRTFSLPVRGRVRPLDFRTRRAVTAAGVLLGCTAITLAGLRLTEAVTYGQEAAATDVRPAPPAAAALPGSVSKGSSAGSSTKGSASPVSPGSSSKGSADGSSAGLSAAGSPAGSQGLSVHSTGLYSRAPGASARHGSGRLRTYRVEVETGAGQSALVFAAAVDATLADRSSWTGQGLWSLQRSEGNVDFVIRLATPRTVDRVCATSGLNTGGYVSCRSGHFVMVNLDRWLSAVPHYRGDVALYRHYLINHEVGHQLGYGHAACPGPGRPAPVMQQQTYGLGGCRPNGWPYVHGKLVTGAARP